MGLNNSTLAVAFEQEMIAKSEEARAIVIEALSKLPVAIAGAFRKGSVYGQG